MELSHYLGAQCDIIITGVVLPEFLLYCKKRKSCDFSHLRAQIFARKTTQIIN